MRLDWARGGWILPVVLHPFDDINVIVGGGGKHLPVKSRIK